MIQIVLTAMAMAALPGDPARPSTEVRLLIRPMAAPVPALRYRLLPDLDELNPGNAAHDYLRCFAEQRPFFYSQQGVSDRDRYRRMPLVELRLEKMGGYGGGALTRADWAARMETVDWQARSRVREGGLEGLPGELGPLQILAESLHARFRIEVAENHFDDAIRTAQTMLAMSRHLAEHPTEVGGQLAMMVAHLGLDALEEMVQQARCPNLYWALTDLPSPLVDLHRAVQGERIRAATELRPLRGDAPMTAAELESLVARLSGVMNLAREQAGLSPRNFRQRGRSRADDPAKVAAARLRLIEAGSSPWLAYRFPPLQVILLDEKRAFEVRRDERIKLLALPLWQIEGLGGDGASDRDALLEDLLPQVGKLRRTQAALEQQIAVLRHVEALRLHAAGHGGKLPAKLSEVDVPLPVDPVTGRAFDYALEGPSAHLRGGSPRGDDSHRRSGVHCVLTLQK